MSVVLLFLNQAAFSCCPDGRMEGPIGGHYGLTDCDPAFSCPDFRPAKPMSDITAEFWSATHTSSENKKGFSNFEMQEWRKIFKQIEENKDAAYDLALEVWGKTFSPEFKRMVMTKSIALVDETERMESLKFLIGCLDDEEKQKLECLCLAKGNGLQRKLAAHRLALINSNPAFRN